MVSLWLGWVRMTSSRFEHTSFGSGGWFRIWGGRYGAMAQISDLERPEETLAWLGQQCSLRHNEPLLCGACRIPKQTNAATASSPVRVASTWRNKQNGPREQRHSAPKPQGPTYQHAACWGPAGSSRELAGQELCPGAPQTNILPRKHSFPSLS